MIRSENNKQHFFIKKYGEKLLAALMWFNVVFIAWNTLAYFSPEKRTEPVISEVVLVSVLMLLGTLATSYVIFATIKAKLSPVITASVIGIQTLTIFLTIVLGFAKFYWALGTTVNFNMDVSKLDAFYFSLGNITSSGTGEINATSEFMRAIVSCQMIVDFLFIITVVTALGLLFTHSEKVNHST